MELLREVLLGLPGDLRDGAPGRAGGRDPAAGVQLDQVSEPPATATVHALSSSCLAVADRATGYDGHDGGPPPPSRVGVLRTQVATTAAQRARTAGEDLERSGHPDLLGGAAGTAAWCGAATAATVAVVIGVAVAVAAQRLRALARGHSESGHRTTT